MQWYSFLDCFCVLMSGNGVLDQGTNGFGLGDRVVGGWVRVIRMLLEEASLLPIKCGHDPVRGNQYMGSG